ncbi:HAMP domain-containing sensor histidine kinase [Wukongibacter baidiensis]|uniref:ATP-binding protein n=1 Tax=Wukongibacter baidiensis TaxID=1723361 RepID=UPI003D7FF0E8
MSKDTFKRIILVSIITTLMGQVYINPFNSDFRLSIGIAILTFLLLKFQDIPILLTTSCTAVLVFIFRFTIDAIGMSKTLYVSDIAVKHLPSAVFYLIFGVALYQLNIRKYKDLPIFFIFLVGISDIVSNVAEAVVRHEFTKPSIEIILTSIFTAGFLRATIAFVLYSSIKAYNMFILKEEHQKRYINLLLFTANMKAEVFFLKKNMQDIEQAMERSYSIYTELKDIKEVIDINYTNKLRRRVLNLAKDIHEIKKDNQRVVSGIERLLPQEKRENTMKLSTIFKMLRDNTTRYIEDIGKDINIFTHYTSNYQVKDYYQLISVINNIIINSIDAIENKGNIKISQYKEDEYIVFKIVDSGMGIKDEDIGVIFEPGFSTKFDRKTGKMSTGLGLTHVKHIVYNYFGGKIEVTSKVMQGCTFSVYIPIRSIIPKEER